MNSRKKILFLSSIALLLTSSLATAGGSTLLQFKYKKGGVSSYTMDMNQQMQMTSSMAPGTTQKIGTNMKADFSQKVKSVKNGKATLEISFQKLDAKAQVGTNPMPIPGLDGFTKVKIQMTADSRGQMSDVKVLKTDSLSPQAKQMAAELQKSWAQNSLVFPAKPIAPGATWSVDRELPTDIGGGSLVTKVSSKYKFIGMEKHMGKTAAKISTDVKVSLHGTAMQMGVPMKTDMDGSGKGTTWFLIDEGKMLHTDADIVVKGSVKGQQSGQSFSTDMNIDMKMDIKLK